MRQFQCAQPGELRQNLGVLLAAFAETEAGIHYNSCADDAGLAWRDAHRRPDRPSTVSITSFSGGSLAHVSGVPAHMVQDETGVGLRDGTWRDRESNVRALGSLIMSTPSSKALRATPDL